jgi:hypothetical protein
LIVGFGCKFSPRVQIVQDVQDFDFLSIEKLSLNNLDFCCLFQFRTLIFTCPEFELLSAKKISSVDTVYGATGICYGFFSFSV